MCPWIKDSTAFSGSFLAITGLFWNWYLNYDIGGGVCFFPNTLHLRTSEFLKSPVVKAQLYRTVTKTYSNKLLESPLCNSVLRMNIWGF